MKKGFTLAEVVIALGVIAVGIVGILSAAGQILTLSSATRNELIASQLAVEGVEIIRNFRDNNWLNGKAENDSGCGIANSWRTGLCAGLWQADFLETSLDNDAPVTEPLSNENAATKLLLRTMPIINLKVYVQSGPYPESIFRRVLEIIDIDEKSFKVRVTVWWEGRGGQRCAFDPTKSCLVIEDVLYNWL